MLYIISTIHDNTNNIITYRGFDTYSDSCMGLSPDNLRDAISNNKIQLVNATIQKGNIVLKDWVKV